MTVLLLYVHLLTISFYFFLAYFSLPLLPPYCLAPSAWGTVATVVLVASYCDRCMKSGMLIDFETGQPASSEFKQKLNKFSTPKVIPLKRAIKILSFLRDVSQPHWTMAPMSSRCMEYNVQLPWTGESQARLLHLLFFAAGVGDDNLIQRVKSASGTRVDVPQSSRNSRAASPSASASIGPGRSSPSADDSMSLCQSSIAGSEENSITRAKSPLTPLIRFMKEKTASNATATAASGTGTAPGSASGNRRRSTDYSAGSMTRRASATSSATLSGVVSSLYLRDYPGM